MYEVIVEDVFSAAHNLRDYNGECENLHGHNWKVQIILESEEVDDQGMVIDFNVIKRTIHDILERYDHRYLNEFKEFISINPTTENISRLLYKELSVKLPKDVSVKKVITWESKGFGASYYE